MLTVAESIALLALDDEKGTAGWQQNGELDYGLAGALLGELALRGCIEAQTNSVAVLDPAPFGDPLLDEALALVAGSTKPQDAVHWVKECAGKVKHLRDRVCEGLVEQGILHREEHTTLFVFHSTRYPASDPTPEEQLRAALRTVLQEASDGAPPETRMLLLISLARATGVLDNAFPKDERKAARKRAEAMTKDEPWGDAVAKAVRERQTINATTAAIAATSGGAAAH